MKYMTEGQKKEYPNLALMSSQCQSYVMSTYGGCTGCDHMVPGCEKAVVAGQIKRDECKCPG